MRDISITDKDLFNANAVDAQRELLRRRFADTDRKMEECRKELHKYGALAKLHFYITELEHETMKALAKARGL